MTTTTERKDTYPLSAGQKSLWFMHQTLTDRAVYHVALAVRIHSTPEPEQLRRVLQTLFDRHESLRTVFRMDSGGELYQQVLGLMPVDFEQTDASGWSDTELNQAVNDSSRRRFDLINGPLFRAGLFTGQQTVLLLTAHHIVFDGQSLFTLLTELQELWGAAFRGTPQALRPLRASFRDFVDWQATYLAGDQGQVDLAYWLEQIRQMPPVLDLPTDRPRPPQIVGPGGSVAFELPEDLMAPIRQMALEQRVYLFDIFAAAFQVFLFRYSGQKDFLTGFVTSGRPERRFARLTGLFSNPVVLRAELSADPPFQEFLQSRHRALAEGLTHQNLPFRVLADKANAERVPGCMPLIQVLFNYFKINRTTPFAELLVARHEAETVQSDGLQMSAFELEQNDGDFDLVLEVAEGRRYWARFRYRADLFDRSTVERLTAHFLVLLRSALDAPGCPVSRLPMLGNEERQRLLYDQNRTTAAFPHRTGVHELFEAQVAATPDKTAVRCGAVTMTYAELNRAANSLAALLKSQGAGPGVLVGLCLERSADMLITVLAILKSGAAYLPLDPHFPRLRLDLILEDARPLLVLTESRLAHLIGNGERRVVLTDRESIPHAGENLPPCAGGEHLAYVLYTSGSTGRPKGVEIPHRAFVNFLLSMRKEPGITSEDVLLAVTTISFDIAGLEMMLPLIAGAQVVIATRDMVTDGRLLTEAIGKSGITVLQATPATWRLLLDSGWTGTPQLKALCGGEALSREMANQLLARTGSLWNMYGPTETTIWSAVHKVERGHEAVPLGHGIDNTTLYILDSSMEPVPVAVAGELYIGGAGLARGYRDGSVMTAEKFVPDPFQSDSGGRLYRTGDACRRLNNGSIVFLSRLDEQVKIRGHRIETGDIESALLGCAGVREAVVVVNEDSSAGTRLVAYLTGEASQTPGLRDQLAKGLPDYMIPAAFVWLGSLPLTPNGKVDRKRLRTLPVATVESGAVFTPPRTATEVSVAKLWSEMLAVKNPCIHTRFEEMGGDSLSFALMIVRLGKRLGVELPVRMDENMLTISGLALATDEALSRQHRAPTRASTPTQTQTQTMPPMLDARKPLSGRFFLAASAAMVRLLARVELEGFENVPNRGPVILAGNHISMFDFLIFGSVPGRPGLQLKLTPTFIIADKWRRCINAYTVQLGNPLYIRRGQADMETLAGAFEVLAKGGAVAIMPEGKPTRGALTKAKPGVAWLAAETNAVVVPIAIFGHERAFRYWPRLRRVPVSIRIGEPFVIEPGQTSLEDYQQKADLVMARIAGLMPREYHGPYAAPDRAEGPYATPDRAQGFYPAPEGAQGFYIGQEGAYAEALEKDG